MIRLEHITKYYNKHKVNQITVSNDINLSFPDQGLVVILGASGSGKTTLLNIISGLDSFDHGTLVFDDIVFRRYSHQKWDQIRKEKIGYVYQHYHLLKHLTVIENIEPVFRMQGIDDANQIRAKVLRLLDAVGMSHYADRLVRQLSGGQQQRVAFARALANNPKVILADEPTGNLDSKTTIEVMNVIKDISKTRLVILVTHEKKLSEFYADRIITIDDGRIISDRENASGKTLDLLQEHIITLSDFKQSNLKLDRLNVSRYTDQSHPDKLDIDLIERNQTLYIKVNSKTLKRTKYIDDDSEIVVQETRQARQSKEDAFVLDDLKNEQEKHRHRFNLKDTFHYAVQKLNIFQKGGRMLFMVMLALGMIISISTGLLGEIFHVEEGYQDIDANYITVTMDRTQYDDYQLLESVPGVDQLMLINQPYDFIVDTPDYYQLPGSVEVSAQPIDIKFFDPETLIYGAQPGLYEIVIDRSVADWMLNKYESRGLQSYADILLCRFKIQTHGRDSDLAIDSGLYFNISGIADANSKSVWMAEELMYSLVTPSLIDPRILGDNVEIIQGTLPTSSNYIVLNKNYPSVYFDEIPYNIGIATGTYYVSGLYDYQVDGLSYNLERVFLSSLDFIKDKYFRYRNFRYSDFELLVYAEDVETTLENLLEAGYTAQANIYEPSLAQQIKLEENQVLYWLGLGGILCSAFIIFLIMRSSLLSRLYEVSVYRSIGVSRSEIKGIFLVELLLTTTFSSVLGFLLMVMLLNNAQASLDMVRMIRFSPLVIIIVIIGMYLINAFFGLIPIHMLLYKTPATMMKQNDL